MKKKVFVVDDESLIASLIQSAIEADGDVSHIGTGKSCIDRLTKEQPDMLFVDMHIPEMGGLDMVSKIRRNPDLAKIPVVIMSSNHSEFEKNLVLSQGVEAYICKPLNYNDISGAMSKLKPTPSIPAFERRPMM